MLKEVSIKGLRGFTVEQKICLAQPNGEKGSGLTTLVGINNSGKTTIIEAIKYFNSQTDTISFSAGKRNKKSGDKVIIKYIDSNENKYSVYTKDSGGSQVEIDNTQYVLDVKKVPFILPSRRHVNYEINGGGFYQSDRWDYVNSELNNSKVRKPIIDSYYQRIFNWELNREKFNQLLYKVIDRSINWYIEQNDNGSYFLAFKNENETIHSSEGIGDGIWSVFTIIDTLYDSEDEAIIVIDEPELSLHPLYQKRIRELLLEMSKTKQIIIATHSPYFISWKSLQNGGILYRTFKTKNGDINVKSLDDEDIKFINNCIKDYYNPHVWGLEAKELFFLEDNIIIVEGQEDVIAFNKLQEEFSIEINASFFGWGAGGAEKIEKILKILKHLGYEKVIAIYDGDKKELFEECKAKFPSFEFMCLWKDDIRDKPLRTIQYKEGILDSKFKVKEGTKEEIGKFLMTLNDYFKSA